MPLPYTAFLFVLATVLSYILLKIDVPTTWKSLLTVAVAHTFLCSRVQYRSEKVWLLKQYSYLLFCSYTIDFVLITIPFFLLNPIFGITTCVTAIFYAAFCSLLLQKPKISIVVPSPFFVKSSFLWHAQMRYLIPCAWIFILIFIIIGHLNDNPNLAFVAFGGGTFLACVATIFQSEKLDFIQIYTDEKQFIKRTIIETVLNTIIFMLPLAMVMIFLFPDNRWIILLVFASVILLNINALWIKYAFFPAQSLVLVLFPVSLVFFGTLATTIYGLVLLPIYYALLFRFYKKNIRKILMNDERIDN
jgi:hypothetical protein